MSNNKIESYYKTLGTTANIGNARIKEKYIQALKKHPPETDPEGFEKVRQAYEALKDPEKRKQYDLVRKYGENVEGLIEEAFDALETKDFKTAEKILGKAAEISPNNPSVLLSLMTVAIEGGNLVEAESLFKKILDTIPASEQEEIATLYSLKVNLLLEHEHYDEAEEVLQKGEALYPDYSSLFALSYAALYMETGFPEKAWKSINAAIPTLENESFEDLDLFMAWSDFMMNSEKWNEQTKVQSRFRKFIKNITDEGEREVVYDYLEDHFQWMFEEGKFRNAEFYIDLLRVVDSRDAELKEMQNETKKLARVQKEVERLEQDDNAFPLLYIHAFEWFYEGIIPSEQLSLILNSIPSEMIAEMKQEKEEYEAGILRLHKKYPLLYRHFKENWDHLFNELTRGFNREKRRELRRIK